MPNSDGVIVPFYFSNCCDCSARGPYTAERIDGRVGWNNRVEEPK